MENLLLITGGFLLAKLISKKIEEVSTKIDEKLQHEQSILTNVTHHEKRKSYYVY